MQNKITSNFFSFPSSITSFLLGITNKLHPSTSEARWNPYSVKTACLCAYTCSFENATRKVPKCLIGLCKTCIRQKTCNVRIIKIQHVNRMPRNKLPRVMKYYSPTGRRNHGRPLKRLLDTWDRNGSTSGQTPWKVYDNDDDDDDNTLTSNSKEHSCLLGKLPNDTAHRRRTESPTTPMWKLITIYCTVLLTQLDTQVTVM